MGASQQAGNIKYVFTQALAPSGEGEVEGSLWYNTTLNQLETYNGVAWVTIASGGYAIVTEGTIAGGAVQNIDFTGLDLDTDKAYMLIITGFEASTNSNSFSIYANADYTATNYIRQRFDCYDGNMVASTGNDAIIASATSASGWCHRMMITQTADGILQVENFGANCISGVGTANMTQMMVMSDGALAANLTALRFISSVAASIGNDSHYILAKLRG